jgi:hypothetical protein
VGVSFGLGVVVCGVGDGDVEDWGGDGREAWGAVGVKRVKVSEGLRDMVGVVGWVEGRV